jgi:chorismate dehydratase
LTFLFISDTLPKMTTLKIGSVAYTNSLPLTHYLPWAHTKDTPAALTEQILNDTLNVALLPVGSILQHNLQAYPEAGLIGCDGLVKSVGFFTKPHIQSLHDIQTLYLDVESKTSVLLAQILLKHHLQRNLKSIQLVPLSQCHLADAQLLIGDKALFFSEPGYTYHDLGELWQKHSGHGFIFACWASKKPLSRLLIADLMQAKEQGLANLSKIAEATIDSTRRAQVLDYWQNNIVYQLNDSLKKGFAIFDRILKSENFFNQSTELNDFYRYLNSTQPKEIFSQN